jgi:hypothetical protein
MWVRGNGGNITQPLAHGGGIGEGTVGKFQWGLYEGFSSYGGHGFSSVGFLPLYSGEKKYSTYPRMDLRIHPSLRAADFVLWRRSNLRILAKNGRKHFNKKNAASKKIQRSQA